MPKTLLMTKDLLQDSCNSCLQSDRIDPKTGTCLRCDQQKLEKPRTVVEYSLSIKYFSKSLQTIFSLVFLLVLVLILVFILPSIFQFSLPLPLAILFSLLPLIPVSIFLIPLLRKPVFMLDQTKSKIIERWELFFPIKENYYFPSDIDFLEISCQILFDQKGQTKQTFYPIKAYFKKTSTSEKYAKDHITFDDNENYTLSLRHAQKLARYFNVALKDICGKEPMVYSTYDLGHNLITKLANTTKPAFLPKEPEICRIEYEINPSNNTSIFVLPSSGIISYAMIGFILLATFIFSDVLIQIFTKLELFAVVISCILLTLCTIKVKETIIITPSKFLLKTDYLFKTYKVVDIPISQLQEIKLIRNAPPSKDNLSELYGFFLSAFSQDLDIEFGRVLTKEESYWLFEALNYSIYQQFKDSSLLKEPTPPQWDQPAISE